MGGVLISHVYFKLAKGEIYAKGTAWKPDQIFSVHSIEYAKSALGALILLHHVLIYRLVDFYVEIWICMVTNDELIAHNIGETVSQLLIPCQIIYKYIYLWYKGISFLILERE